MFGSKCFDFSKKHIALKIFATFLENYLSSVSLPSKKSIKRFESMPISLLQS